MTIINTHTTPVSQLYNHTTEGDANKSKVQSADFLPATLLTAFKLSSSMTLQNRLVMAPITRCLATQNIPTDAMAEFYGRRGYFGLIISEATMIDPDSSGYPDTPGIYSQAQVEAWQKVCEKVHQKGAKFFLQLWHAGMMSHPIYRDGKQTLAPSSVMPLRKSIPRSNPKLEYEAPKPMDLCDIQELKKAFLQAARNALKAGCDGIELHAGSGYLLDSFLHYHTNGREDLYGGTPENMCRLLLEIVNDLIDEIGADKIGVRLSPVPVPSMKNMQEDKRDREVFIYLLGQLQLRGIAYVHTCSDNDVQDIAWLNSPVSSFLKEHFKGHVIGGGSYSPASAAKAIYEGQFELISFGRLTVANPNLVELIKGQNLDDLKIFEGHLLNTYQ